MKLYWRLKLKGKWTWRPVQVHVQHENAKAMFCRVEKPAEEE